MPAPALLSTILARLRSEPSRSGSIIITIYGEAIVPRGGCIWLGTLLEFFRAIEISEGVVRTAVSRLTADGWLERTRLGRKSFYRLAGCGEATFAAAAARIYGTHQNHWGGFFRLAMLEAGEAREPARLALEAAGYASAAPGLLVATDPAPTPAITGVLYLDASTAPDTARQLAARVWPVARTAAAYGRFLTIFGSAERALQDAVAASGIDALVARVLLIHEYRRVVLRDPLLPAALLPQPWPGDAARRVCAAIYRTLLPASEHWLDAHGLNANGPLPSPGEILAKRFQD
jgi:phenylacetic acid degradation operon negative regulatory protein